MQYMKFSFFTGEGNLIAKDVENKKRVILGEYPFNIVLNLHTTAGVHGQFNRLTFNY